MRLQAWRRRALAAGLLAWAGVAAARPFTLDDLLGQESLGAEAVDPTGRWLVFERRDPYDTAQRYDGFLKTSAQLTRLRAIDLARPPARARALVRGNPRGLTLGPFSPTGSRLAVYRIAGRRLSIGVVTLATGRLRGFDITPEDSDWSRDLQWRSDRELLVIARPGATPPWTYRLNEASETEVPARWAATATGGGAHTVVGSGVYLGVRPHPPPDRLLALDAVSGRARTLARGPFFDLEVSPDRRRVALFAAGGDIQPRADGPVEGLEGISTQVTQLAILDLRTGVLTRPCPGRDALPHLLQWSPSGRSLLVFTRAPGALWSTGRLDRIDAASGGCEALAPGLRPALSLRPERIEAGWMGEQPIVLAHLAAGPKGRDDWWRLAPAGPVRLTAGLPTAPRQLAGLDPQGFTALVEGRGWRVSRDGADQALPVADAVPVDPARTSAGTQRADLVPPAGRWLLEGPATARRLLWLGAAGAGPALPVPAGIEPEVVASSSHRAALVARVDAHGTTRLRLVRPDAAPRTVATLNPGLDAVDPPEVRAIPHPGPHGEALTSWLFLPPTRSARPPPLVVRPYLGLTYRPAPRELAGERGLISSVRLFTAHGYAVLIPSLPVRDPRELMAGVADQIEQVIRAAEADPATAGRFDPDRVALWGHSFGGYTVMAAIEQTDRYRAAVSIAGVSDFLGKWGSLPPPWRAAPEEAPREPWSAGSVESGQEGLGGPPWTDLARYVRNSPLWSADRIHTPLMLVHGDQDVIPIEQSEAMFSALYRQSKDALLVTYWGENHMMMNPGNVRDLYARIFAFLDPRLGLTPAAATAARPRSPGRAPASGGPRPPPRRPRGSPWRARPG